MGSVTEASSPGRSRPLRRALRPRAATSKRVLGYRASQVLEFVRTTIARTGRAPSYGMICEALGISTKGEVSDIVKGLERRGLLTRVGAGRVRRGRQWNAPVLRLTLAAAYPVERGVNMADKPQVVFRQRSASCKPEYWTGEAWDYDLAKAARLDFRDAVALIVLYRADADQRPFSFGSAPVETA